MALDPTISMAKQMAQVQPDMRYSGGDVRAWQRQAREKLAHLVGYQGKPTQANYTVEWVHQENGYTETRFTFDTEPDVTSIGHILIPDSVREKVPMIVCVQGHAKGMHVSLGRPKYPGEEATIFGGDRNFAQQIVARGQIALALEQRGFGERGGTADGPDCHQAAVQALLVGRTLIGQRCWDISRAIDVVQAHFPQVDSDRIALMGNSGGGTATIYAAALDERIAAAMPSCALAGFRASIGMLKHCICNYVPGIMLHFDMGDLVALAAPRPYVAVNGVHDEIFPLESAKEQWEIARRVYGALGAEEKLRHVVGPEGHRFYADLAWPVFDEITGWKNNG